MARTIRFFSPQGEEFAVKRTAAVVALALLVAPWGQATAPAQRAEAVLGEPFGVGRVEIEPSRADGPDLSALVLITDNAGRVYYPAVGNSGAGRALRGVLERIQRPRLRALGELAAELPKNYAYFLFRGQAPLSITVHGQNPFAVSVTPVDDPLAYRRLAEQWWRAYGASSAGLMKKRPDYPPIVDTYLQAMLARRLELPAPPASRKSWSDVFEHELGLSLQTEPLRVSMLQERMLGQADLGQAADVPLPAPILAPEPPVPDPAADVKIEPIAMAVPEECLYVRFGSFPNFLWFQDTMNRWGGDMRNMMAQRGINYNLTDRSQRQMILRQTELARLFGETAIADAAIVASDLFLPEGAAMGILFQARNNLILGASLGSQRSEALRANKGAKEEKLAIAGRNVSFISTPDNTIRSFYGARGDFHFVTTSRTLMQRFLEAAGGQRALGGSKEFRSMRSARPADPDDTAFVYISAGFFQNIVRPAYRVEIARRLQAAVDIEAAEMAQLAAAAEAQPGDTVEQLRAGGFLPPDFGPRPDGSRTVIEDARVYDSLRGARGTFLPVPDVEVKTVTPAEAEDYARFAQYYAGQLGPVEPIVVSLRRQPAGQGRERVIVDASLGPLNRSRHEFFAQWLGAPDSTRIAPIPGDIIFFEAVLRSTRLFLGLRDFGPPPEQAGGLSGLLGLLPSGGLRNLFYGYIGTAGGAGPLGILDQAITGAADPAGYAQSPRLLFRRQVDPFRVFSLHREILAEVTPQLRFEPAERPAQVRLRVADLSRAGIAPVAQQWAYRRAMTGTLGNLRLIHAMIQQFHVPADDALAAAQLILGANLVCPLGGTYVYRPAAGGAAGSWTSTALEAAPAAGLPEGFTAAPLNWFRGLNLDALLTPDRFSAHAEVDMELSAKAAAPK